MTQHGSTTRHLTEEELEEVLLGLDSTRSEDHLAECAVCREKIDEFRGSLELFNQASMAWSEAKSNSLNRDLADHRTPFRMSVRTVWTSALMVVVVLAGLMGLGERGHRTLETGMAPRASASAEQRADATGAASSEIASDNAMMQQIDAAINAPEASPSELYGRGGANGRRRLERAASVRN